VQRPAWRPSDSANELGVRKSFELVSPGQEHVPAVPGLDVAGGVRVGEAAAGGPLLPESKPCDLRYEVLR
jgi:hypothetical protein